MTGTTNVPCTYLVLKKGTKALFVLRSNTGYQDGNYSLPAGHVEAMESFSQATVREALEEVGVTVDPMDLNHLITMHRNCGDHVRIDIFFATNKWQGEPINGEPNKHSKIAWLDLDNLPENTMDYTAYALTQSMKGVRYVEYGWNR
jgi:8-oxo-dGTP diphosphatase